MKNLYPLIFSPVIWVFLSAFFLGGVLDRITRSVNKKKDPDKAGKTKLIMTALGTFLSAGFIITGLILCGVKKIADMKMLVLFVSITVLIFLVLKFKKAIGIPAVILAALMLVFLSLFVRSLVSFTGETEIAKVKVISAENRNIEMNVSRPGKDTVNIKLQGDAFAPIVQEIIFDDLYVFLGSSTKYRFLGFTAFNIINNRYRQTDTDLYFSDPQGISEKLFAWFEKNSSMIPGVKSVQVEIVAKRPVPSKEYSLMIQNDGGLQIVESK
jgi:hypothetical protein